MSFSHIRQRQSSLSFIIFPAFRNPKTSSASIVSVDSRVSYLHHSFMDYFRTLPEEILLDILTRLPTESVLDSKVVCRNWRNVISHHPSFSRIHLYRLNHPAAESGKFGFLALTFRHDRLYYFEYDENHDQSTPPIKRITKINLTSPFENSTFRIVGSVNGLVCLLERFPFRINLFVCIWNPITKECIMLPEIKGDGDTEYEDTSFGYVSSTNEYKVVRFYKFKAHLEIHVYTLGSGSGWRNLGKVNCASNLYLKHLVFFANGALYWLDHALQMIGAFDLTEKKFCEHLSPPPLPPVSDWSLQCAIGVLDGILFFALEDKVDGCNDIWLMKKKNHNHDMEEGEKHQSLGWRKEFRINDMNFLAVMKSGGVFTYGGNYLNIYDAKTATSKSLVKFNSCIVQVLPHKNTLISLKELGEEDAKVVESAEIEDTKRREQLQDDADPEYIYL